MSRRFVKVSEEEIKTAFFYPSDLVNTKTTIPLRVGEERWIYTLSISLIYAVFRLWRRTHAFKFYSEMYKGLKQEKKSKKF